MRANRREGRGIDIQSDGRVSSLAKREMERSEKLGEDTVAGGRSLTGERREDGGSGIGDRRGEGEGHERYCFSALLDMKWMERDR